MMFINELRTSSALFGPTSFFTACIALYSGSGLFSVAVRFNHTDNGSPSYTGSATRFAVSGCGAVGFWGRPILAKIVSPLRMITVSWSINKSSLAPSISIS